MLERYLHNMTKVKQKLNANLSHPDIEILTLIDEAQKPLHLLNESNISG